MTFVSVSRLGSFSPFYSHLSCYQLDVAVRADSLFLVHTVYDCLFVYFPCGHHRKAMFCDDGSSGPSYSKHRKLNELVKRSTR